MKLYAFRVFWRAATKKKNQSNQGTTPQNIVQNQETEFIEEVSGLTESGWITPIISNDQTFSWDRFNIESNRGRFQARGKGKRPFVRQTGENDPHGMSIAPMFIYENQMLPTGIHNLSKSFRPNLATIRDWSLGPKFIPKYNFEKRNNTFIYFNNFIRRIKFISRKLNRVFLRNARFKLKSNFVANIQCKEINLFGWRVRGKIKQSHIKMVKHKFGQR